MRGKKEEKKRKEEMILKEIALLDLSPVHSVTGRRGEGAQGYV